MRKIFVLVVAAVAICLAGCTREMNHDNPVNFVVGSPITLTVTQDPCQIGGTKTTVKNDCEVWWESGDEIRVIAAGSTSEVKFSSTLAEGETAATSGFVGTLEASAEKFYSVYPHSAGYAIFNIENILLRLEMSLPSAQTARNASFDKGLMPSFGTFTPVSTSFTMKNLCGGLKFRLSRSDVKKIVFEAGGSTGIAGNYTIEDVDSESPVIKRSTEAVSTITLNPAGESFASEVDYFIVMLPGTLPGFKATLTTTVGEVIEVTSTRTQTVKPGVFGELAKPLDEYGTLLIPEYVDLGLSVKWATCNLGADTPEGSGDYYAWGETEPYYEPGYAQSDDPVWKPGKTDGYCADNYKWYNGAGLYSGGKATKYNCHSLYGDLDYRFALELEDDAAHVNLGEKWRMPLASEIEELENQENCEWVLTEQNGVNGYKITSKINRNSIFIPIVGYRYYTGLLTSSSGYWSMSSARDRSFDVGLPSSLTMTVSQDRVFLDLDMRDMGRQIRPVYGDYIPVIYLYSPTSEVTIAPEETIDIEVSVSPENATISRICSISSDPSVVSCDGTSITGVSSGTATVTIYAHNGARITCDVTVADAIPVTKVTLDKSSVCLEAGQTETLLASVYPENATDKTVTWESEDPAIVTVSDGVLTPVGPGTTKVKAISGGCDASCDVLVLQYPLATSGFVDLGLSVKWAVCNVGANEPAGLGYYFAWGETDPKELYNEESYLWYSSSGKFTKYADDVDSWFRLGPQDDAAYKLKGPGYLMPTCEDIDELCNQCDWTYTSYRGVVGAIVTSKTNGNCIFLPAAGYKDETGLNYPSSGFYWSSDLISSHSRAFDLRFNNSGPLRYTAERSFGFSVRAVEREPDYSITGIDLSSDNGKLVLINPYYRDLTSYIAYVNEGGSISIDASKRNLNATNYNVVLEWESSDAAVATVSKGVVVGHGPGKAIISTKGGGAVQYCEVTVKGSTCPAGAVDLGLSVYWRDRNLGADSPSEHGGYYAWGEATPKSSFIKYKWYDPELHVFTKYVVNYDGNYGEEDNLKRLEIQDDAASVALGGKWHMPTVMEIMELVDNCDIVSANYGVASGWLLTSKVNGNTLFLPSSGHYDYSSDPIYSSNEGYYKDTDRHLFWSSSLRYYYVGGISSAHCLSIDETPSTVFFSSSDFSRALGATIRPVTE